MGKFMITSRYSSGSWARLVRTADDRTAAVRSLVESLGGSLDLMYWSATESAAFAIADFPDVMAAKAAVTTEFETGAFTAVEMRELLSQDQLGDTLALSRSAQGFYQAPGTAAVEGDV